MVGGSILAADDLARVNLKGQPAAPTASGRAYLSASQRLLFSAVDLPPLPPGRIYQLWYVTATAPLSAALVTPDGGVPAPSGAFYLLGTF